MENIIDVARFFCALDTNASDKKIQKLVYYSYSWFIVKNNKSENNINNRLFNERPEAWIHGPVFPELYREMTYNKEKFYSNDEYKKLSNKTTNFLKTIFSVYGKYTGNQLEKITHNEEPWIKARGSLKSDMSCSELINDKDIYVYYNN